jgi:acetyltransferase-like isoleucine patch superfamily enzyme
MMKQTPVIKPVIPTGKGSSSKPETLSQSHLNLSSNRSKMSFKAQQYKKIHRESLSNQLYGGGLSALRHYRDKTAGGISLLKFFQYELAGIFFANMGGGAGYLFRRRIYGPLLRQAGLGIILGRGITIRNPGNITLGDKVAIDDHVMLDAGGAGADGIMIGDQVIISRNCIIQGKTGPVAIGKRTDIGANTLVSSVSGVTIGPSVLIAGNCYIGGSRYFTEGLNRPVMDQGWYTRGPVSIGEGSWIGAGVIILDGVRIGCGCVVGAGAIVTKDLPDYAVAAGVPCKVIRSRKESDMSPWLKLSRLRPRSCSGNVAAPADALEVEQASNFPDQQSESGQPCAVTTSASFRQRC